MPRVKHRPTARSLTWLVGALAVVATIALPAFGHPAPGGASKELPGTRAPTTHPTPSNAAWNLAISASPGTICPYGSSNCTAGAGTTRVTMSVTSTATAAGANWSNVQVMFLLELLPYDGVYDSYAGEGGSDPCAAKAPYHLCEESNGIPFFVHNASQIASGILATHPGTNVSFGLTTFGPAPPYDDGDGYSYNVAVPNFSANATVFGQQVDNSLLGNTSTGQVGVLDSTYTLGDSDLSDNFLYSDSITALYGAIFGAGVGWSNASHHVVVVIGSTVPVDPNYSVDLCLSNAYTSSCPTYSPTCAPSYTFAIGASPACEGWVVSQTSNLSDSIAAAARTAPACVASLGGTCTVDTIDLWTTSTDPNSKGWPSVKGGGPGSANVTKLADTVLLAGCDLANATGGSWDGPSFYTCPNHVTGTLTMSNRSLNFSNPSFGSALSQVGFGLITHFQGVPAGPMFRYAPGPNVSLVTPLSASASCLRGGVAFLGCAASPEVQKVNGVVSLGWNWSSVTAENFLLSGDSWQVSFEVTVDGPAGVTGIDRCTATGCPPAEAGPSSGTSFTYQLPNGAATVLSFAAASVTVAHPSPIAVQVVAPGGTGFAPATVSLGLTASGGIGPYTATWSFGDGSPSASGWSVDHFFANPGNYTVQVQVTDRTGQTASASALVTVAAPVDSLSVSLTSDRSVDTVGRPVTLYANASGGAGTPQVSWGGLPTGCSAADVPVLSCTPSTVGTYSVAASVTDAQGGSAAASIALLVNPLPSVQVGATTPSGACSGGAAMISFSASVSGGSGPFVYRWTFGDGAQAAGGATIQHPFPAGAAWAASVTVVDAAGATGSGQATASSPAGACAHVAPSAGGMAGVPLAGFVLVGVAAIAGTVVALLARRERR